MNAPTMPQADASYRDRIAEAVLQVLIETSISTASDGTRIAALISGDIIDALLTIEAMLLATSPAVQSPNALRRYCDEHGKRLYRNIRAAQKHPDLKIVFAGGVHTVAEHH